MVVELPPPAALPAPTPLNAAPRVYCPFRNHGVHGIEAGGVNPNQNVVRLE